MISLLAAKAVAILAFVHVNVVPMDRDRLLFDYTVIVEGGRIAKIGPSDSTPPPAGAQLVDGGRAMYLLPGLSDMHTHLRYESDLKLYLANGITTVRNMNGGPVHLQWKKAVAQGTLIGPDVWTAGPVVSGPGTGRVDQISTFAEGERVAERQKKEGYDFIKVYDELPTEAYNGIVAKAKELSIPVVGHIPDSPGLAGALKARQQTIEHLEQFVYDYFGTDFDKSRIAGLASQVKESGTFVCPTLAFISDLASLADPKEKEDVLTRAELKYLHPETLMWWMRQSRRSGAQNRAMDKFHNDLLAGFRDAGVPLLTGTDCYIFGSVMGFSLFREFDRMVRAGLTNYEVLEASTANAGRLLADGTGFVKQDAVANLVLVSSDPRSDLRTLEKPVGVCKRGRWYSAASLQKFLADVEAEFAPADKYAWLNYRRGGQAVLADFKRGGAKPFPHEDDVLNEVGNSLITKKQYAAAIEMLQYVVRDYPKWWAGWDSLGDAQRSGGHRVEADAAYRRSLELNPSNENAKKWLRNDRHAFRSAPPE